uniref:Uncharacterized protein n=1 Tax=Cajanus cajan TaxID=3821 RepID=A0A151UE15_CAJCA|nr:hypothetical protein KK1_030428 [Cajanus cajan]KYP47943.1 hypothetical protein KK1_030430 [Cajanus cajan]
MATTLKERRDSQWNSAWTGDTLSSAPPLPLLAIVGIVVFLLWVSSYLNHTMQTATTNVNLFLLFLPLVLTLVAQGGRLMLPSPKVTGLHDGDAVSESSSMPWGWIVSVLMFLVLISNRLHPIFVVAIVFLYVYFLSA